MVIDGFTIVRCNVCSLDYLNPRLKQGILQEIYDDGYYRSREGYGRDPNSPQEDEDSFYGYNEYLAEEKSIKATFKRRLDIVEKFVAPGTLLDLGCAMGFLLDLARDRGWTVEGVELSEYAYLHAVEKLHLPVRHGTLYDAEFDDGKFDAVTLFDVIEHFPNPRKEIREVARVLRPGGIFAVTTPDVAGTSPSRIGKASSIQSSCWMFWNTWWMTRKF